MPAATTLEGEKRKPIKRAQGDSPVNDEHELIVQARNGSMAAVEELLERYEARIFRLASNITGNHKDAEEVVQNAFVKAFQNLEAFREESRFYTWLVRIAVNEALMRIRGHRFTEVSIENVSDSHDHIVPHELEDWGPNREERYSQEELRRVLETTVRGLAPGYRIVFQLRDVEGFSSEETARTLDLSVPAVKTRLQRARLELRNSLDIHFRRPKSREGKRKMEEFEPIARPRIRRSA